MNIDDLLEVDELPGWDRDSELVAANEDMHRDGILVYDLETVPDHSRFPPPVTGEYEGLPDGMTPEAILDQTIGDIEKVLPDATGEELLNLRTAESQRAKPRKGITGAIDRTLQAREESLSKWVKSYSVNPFTCRIAAFAWAVGDGQPHCITATSDDEEREALVAFWGLLTGERIRAGFGITRFDDQVIISRSVRHQFDSHVTRRLNCRKYGNQEAMDLEQIIFPQGNPQKCKLIAEAWGVEIPCPDMDGSQVYGLYCAGDMVGIAEYAISDVVVERDMLQIATRMYQPGR